jgi:hypothetical protein
LAIAAAIACTVLLASVELAGADSPNGTPTAYKTTAAAAAIVDGLGVDGNLWFVEPHNGGQAGAFDGITPSGALVVSPEVPVNPAPAGLADGVAGTPSAGAVWIASGNVDKAFLGAYSAVSAKPVHTVRLLGAEPGAVAADSQGNLWVTLGSSLAGGAVEEVTLGPLGWTAQLPVSLGGATAASIATGSDGKTMWVTEPARNPTASNGIASITPGASVPVKQFALPTGVSGTLGEIVLGPDGNMYAGLTGYTGQPSYVLQITPPAAGATAPMITPLKLPSDSTANPAVPRPALTSSCGWGAAAC